MKLYRVAKSGYIEDLTGSGARLYGGRWNEKGIPVIYAAASRSLAALELLIRVPLALAPPDLSICEFRLPAGVSVTQIRQARLPADWKTSPPPASTMAIGTRWARAGKSLLLIVPSVIIPDEKNYLINPQHPEFKKIKTRIERFEIDQRLLTRKGPPG